MVKLEMVACSTTTLLSSSTLVSMQPRGIVLPHGTVSNDSIQDVSNKMTTHMAAVCVVFLGWAALRSLSALWK